ncbi:MAG: endonuclease/exonuclease/phosphatase family protein [Ignavibacteriales bacterium]|nr:endonuclease/exonuclease/phosphatase family protein [Ignavibacteriales bacterium]
MSVFSQPPLRVITYNIMGMKPGTNPSARLTAIIENLKQLQPDIIGIQEINETLNGGGLDNQAKTIAESLSIFFGTTFTFYNAYTHLSWNNQYREYIGIITKHPVVQQGFTQLVQGTFPRKVAWNYINTPLGKIHFFNTHFDYQSTSVRLQQATQAMNFITQKETLLQSVATLFTGDFNDTPGTSPINYILNAGFWDSFAKANPSRSGYTVPSNAPTSKIDFIFYRSTGGLTIDSSTVIMNQPYSAGSFPSDHLGVMTIFSLTPSAVDERENVEKDFTLFQNYPNPFNPVTVIRYQLNVKSFVTVKVFDVFGREVAILSDGNEEPGIKTVNFDATGFSSGVYFYRVQAGTYNETKKLLFVR